jgi:hypothetical protein
LHNKINSGAQSYHEELVNIIEHELFKWKHLSKVGQLGMCTEYEYAQLDEMLADIEEQ